jgi:hypothetical protein
MLEMTISLGNIFTILSFLVVVVVYIVTIRGDAKVLNVRLLAIDLQMSEFKAEIRKLAEVVTKQVLADQRISTMNDQITLLQKQLDEVRHGEGFVFPLSRKAASGS